MKKWNKVFKKFCIFYDLLNWIRIFEKFLYLCSYISQNFNIIICSFLNPYGVGHNFTKVAMKLKVQKIQLRYHGSNKKTNHTKIKHQNAMILHKMDTNGRNIFVRPFNRFFVWNYKIYNTMYGLIIPTI